MAFAAAMGIDFAISAVTMGAALLPVEDKPIARIGIGSTALGQKEDARTNGVIPNLHLYDVHGNRFAQQGMLSIHETYSLSLPMINWNSVRFRASHRRWGE
jgi:hypothetical protein